MRPVATWERFVKTREAMQELASTARSEEERTRWIKLELALVLAEATGRRLNSIRQLRWEDVDFERRTIRWRAEADKKRRESTVPIPEDLVDEIKAFRKRLGALGGWVFSRASDGEQPMDRHLFDKWLVVAEKQADALKSGAMHHRLSGPRLEGFGSFTARSGPGAFV
jgi:integrase